jgi:hypothetical protein
MLPYMAQTCPQLPYMAETRPLNILSRPLCHKIPQDWNALNRSGGTEPRQLIGLASDNAHFDPMSVIFTNNKRVIFGVNHESLGSNVNKYGEF